MANIVARLRTEDVRAVGAQHPPLARADSVGIGSDSVVAVSGINTEHLADEGGGARIEVRDVPAQTDYAKFLQDLDVLTKALNGARKIVSDAQIVRVT